MAESLTHAPLVGLQSDVARPPRPRIGTVESLRSSANGAVSSPGSTLKHRLELFEPLLDFSQIVERSHR